MVRNGAGTQQTAEAARREESPLISSKDTVFNERMIQETADGEDCPTCLSIRCQEREAKQSSGPGELVMCEPSLAFSSLDS